MLSGCAARRVKGPALPSDPVAARLIQGYLSKTQAQQDQLKDVEMEVMFEGTLPRLKKSGKLAALRIVSKAGEVAYKMLGFSGDDTVKKEVVARYMTAETQVKQDSGSMAISPANYEFKYKGLQEKDNQQVHVFELKPRQKRVGLFKGELWLDPQTLLPLRETGRFVKNPSIFLKKMDFTRDYAIRDGVAYPKRIESVIETRIVGKAVLAIQFNNIRKREEQASGPDSGGAASRAWANGIPPHRG